MSYLINFFEMYFLMDFNFLFNCDYKIWATGYITYYESGPLVPPPPPHLSGSRKAGLTPRSPIPSEPLPDRALQNLI